MQDEGVEFLRFPVLERYSERIRAGVSTRAGGVSTGDFESLNLGDLSGDDSHSVMENRRRALFHFRAGSEPGAELRDWVGVKQVHGRNVVRVSRDEAGDAVVVSPRELILDEEPSWGRVAEADGITTSDTGLVLAILVADCVPVVIYDPVHHAESVLHCGWRPTSSNLIGRAIELMANEFGSSPRALVAGIGPGICAQCYEVGEEVAGLFLGEVYEGFRVVWEARQRGEEKSETKFQLNLWGAIFANLTHAGLLTENISTTVKCSFESEEVLFSHRRDEGKTGRNALLAELLP